MRIFAGGVATESNSFSVMRTGLEDFSAARLDLSALWGPQAESGGHELVVGPYAWANPSGPTVRSAYETLRGELLAALRAALPVDVALLMLHGAMLADGYEDCEEDLIGAVRAIVGAEAVVGVELDLHAHVRAEKIAAADVVIAYKQYPHTDIADRARELFDLCLAARRGEITPVMALCDCRMVGQFPTTEQPLRGFVEAMTAAEGREGVLSVSLFHGFRLGDVPHMGAKVLAVADGSPGRAEAVARRFAERLIEIRDEISLASRALPLEAALARAMAAPRGPVVVADQADNPGSGGPGDSTFALRWLVEHDADAALGLLYDPEVVRIARKAGVGAPLRVRLGGKTGETSGMPVDLDVTVTALADDYRLPFPQTTGEPIRYRAGDVVALRCRGLDILVNNAPVQCYGPAAFADLGIDPSAKKVLVVKSAQHFQGAFAPIAAEILYMSTPGAAPADPRLIRYRNFDPSGFHPWTAAPVVGEALAVRRA
jgi:microcystin degradation protein MlrC